METCESSELLNDVLTRIKSTHNEIDELDIIQVFYILTYFYVGGQ
jgi:hypothetical protein